MTTHAGERDIEAIVIAVRAIFARLRSVADALHADLGVSAAMRAVIETVSENDRVTVPEVARQKRVSRQNIQVIVDGLVVAGLLDLADNPAHKRSPLLRLTRRGRRVFDEMRRRERSVVAALAADLSPATAATTRAGLAAIQARLEAMETHNPAPKGEHHD